ncbi:hypothetical protein Tco_0797696 [Tanacetum coccineum]
MANHSQKWHDGSTSRRVSNNSSNGITAIANKLDSLGRYMKKLKENEHAIRVGCENCGGAHLNKECSLNEEVKSVEEVKYEEFRRPFQNNNGNGARYQYIEDSAKKEVEHDEWLRKLQETIEIYQRGHDEILYNLEMKVKALTGQ